MSPRARVPTAWRHFYVSRRRVPTADRDFYVSRRPGPDRREGFGTLRTARARVIKPAREPSCPVSSVTNVSFCHVSEAQLAAKVQPGLGHLLAHRESRN